MREPTNLHAAYEWHRRALAGEIQPVHELEPRLGWYRRTLCKGGPWVPARIWIQQKIDPVTGELTEPEVLCCQLNGEDADPVTEWTWLAKNPISEEHYERMMFKLDWCAKHKPDDPIMFPRRPLDASGRVPWPGARR